MWVVKLGKDLASGYSWVILDDLEYRFQPSLNDAVSSTHSRQYTPFFQ
jgi:hypothetical protein